MKRHGHGGGSGVSWVRGWVMPKENTPGTSTTRRYSSEERAAAVRMVRTLPLSWERPRARCSGSRPSSVTGSSPCGPGSDKPTLTRVSHGGRAPWRRNACATSSRRSVNCCGRMRCSSGPRSSSSAMPRPPLSDVIALIDVNKDDILERSPARSQTYLHARADGSEQLLCDQNPHPRIGAGTPG